MLTTRREPTQELHALTPAERDWIRRQGRAARTLEERQRRLAISARRQGSAPAARSPRR